MSARGRWYITRAAVEAYLRLRRWADDDKHFDLAEDELIDLAATAQHRETDARGRQLWRSGRPLQLRWVVSPAARVEGSLPQVVWIGQGRPPSVCWEPRV